MWLQQLFILFRGRLSLGCMVYINQNTKIYCKNHKAELFLVMNDQLHTAMKTFAVLHTLTSAPSDRKFTFHFAFSCLSWCKHVTPEHIAVDGDNSANPISLARAEQAGLISGQVGWKIHSSRRMPSCWSNPAGEASWVLSVEMNAATIVRTLAVPVHTCRTLSAARLHDLGPPVNLNRRGRLRDQIERKIGISLLLLRTYPLAVLGLSTLKWKRAQRFLSIPIYCNHMIILKYVPNPSIGTTD